jgi:hypothetical protein
MIRSRLILPGQSVASDPYAADLILLAHLHGMTDETGNYTLTNAGADLDTGEYKFSPSSYYFDNTYPTHIALDTTLSVPSTDYWTAEGWCLISNSVTSTDLAFQVMQRGGAVWRIGTFGPTDLSQKGTVLGGLDSALTSDEYNLLNPTKGTWHHFAVCNGPADGSGYCVKLYWDGSPVAPPGLIWQSNLGLEMKYIGWDAKIGYLWYGNIAEIRITRACRYTSAFTPPTAPFPDP